MGARELGQLILISAMTTSRAEVDVQHVSPAPGFSNPAGSRGIAVACYDAAGRREARARSVIRCAVDATGAALAPRGRAVFVPVGGQASSSRPGGERPDAELFRAQTPSRRRVDGEADRALAADRPRP